MLPHLNHPKDPRHGWIKTLTYALLGLFAGVISIRAETPSVDYLFPAGGTQGTNLLVTAGGKLDPWPLDIWTDSPHLKFNAETNKGTFRVEIATNAPLGAHLVSFYNRDGASAPRLFIVGCWDEIKETNNLTVQAIDRFPVVINGRLDKRDDSDSFKIRLEKGQCLVAGIEGYRLDSPIDPLLQLLDANGTQVAFSHDRHKLDPLLAYSAPETGDYTLQVFAFAYPPRSEVSLMGSDAAVYRLALTTGPFVDYAFPPGISRGAVSSVHLTGWNLGDNGDHLVREIDAKQCSPTQSEVEVTGFGPTPLLLPISAAAEARELEPNDSSDVAQRLNVASAVNGRIEPAGETDRFRFEAKAKERYRIVIQSARFEFPLDPVLLLESADGRQLAKNDDVDRNRDSRIDWTAPEDGTFFVAVSDLLGRGGPDYIYRLEISHPTPSFEATADSHTLRIEPGKSTDLKVTVGRLDGFSSPIVVVAQDLPEGIVATSAEVPAKGGDVKITLTAADDAKPYNTRIRILAIATDPTTPHIEPASCPIKGQNAAAGHLLINNTDQVWLTVLPKPESKPAKE